MIELKMAYEILDLLKTMQEVVKFMKESVEKEDDHSFQQLCTDLLNGVEVIQEFCRQNIPEGSKIKLLEASQSVVDSLKDIIYAVACKSKKRYTKIEYELLPIIETMTLQFYYWGIVYFYPEEEKNFKMYLHEIGINSHLREAEKTGEYKYDLTIMILAYNHLDYTKLCVESVLQNIPDGITYELVLFNHGSNDGTKEYFENIPNAKVLNVSINFSLPGVQFRVCEGKFILTVSNDIIIGTNAIENMLKCMLENDNIGWIVPSTPNVSNLQTMDCSYRDFDEFKIFTQKNNKYDVLKHENRIRLCNPLDMMSGKNLIYLFEEIYLAYFCVDNINSYPDDKLSLWFRRNGYRLVLMKDAYCHHFGSVTIREDDEKKESVSCFYLEGRRKFLEQYGVDPWGVGFCYDMRLFGEWEMPVIHRADILGINCGLGANSLKIKEILKEHGCEQMMLYNMEQEERYLRDLKGVSDKACCFQSLDEIEEKTGIKRFDYIIIETQVNGYEDINCILHEMIRVHIDFKLFIYKLNDGEHFQDIDGYDVEILNDWLILSKV